MITASLATIPAREPFLKMVVDSLLPQVDLLYVQLNGYDSVPECLDYDNIVARLTTNEMGDANKFMNVDIVDSFFFTCDDDLIYPPDYTQTLINKLDEYGPVIVTCHGRVFPKGPHESYYASKIITCHCLSDVPMDCLVHVGGTGVMAFHTDTIDIRYEDFKEPNMADIWLAKQAYEQYVPIICIEHREGWIKALPVKDTIWDNYSTRDEVQTEAINSFL